MSWMQTRSGRAVDLQNPTPQMIDFGDVAWALARIARFIGHTGPDDGAEPYSVAQHSVLGAEVLLAETGDRALAAAFLLHDAHEAYLGDMSTPAKMAYAETGHRLGGYSGYWIVNDALGRPRRLLDEAIYAAAGVTLPGAADDARRILKETDIRLLLAERNALFRQPPPRPWNETIEQARPLPDRMILRPWPWSIARIFWRDMLDQLAPAAALHQPEDLS